MSPTGSSPCGRRPVVEADRPFLLELYASTRQRELDVVPWTDAQKREFIEMQFHAQDSYYRQHYPDCEFSLLLCDEQPCGRLYVDRRADEIRIVDIALLPSHRNRGIGGALMREILEEARGLKRAVRIHVERDNPAMQLYLRLGFLKVGESGVYDLMEWLPEGAT